MVVVIGQVRKLKFAVADYHFILQGVDPELYALTTSKVECSSASNKVTDAFARLMSTAETTSTSTR